MSKLFVKQKDASIEPIFKEIFVFNCSPQIICAAYSGLFFMEFGSCFFYFKITKPLVYFFVVSLNDISFEDKVIQFRDIQHLPAPKILFEEVAAFRLRHLLHRQLYSGPFSDFMQSLQALEMYKDIEDIETKRLPFDVFASLVVLGKPKATYTINIRLPKTLFTGESLLEMNLNNNEYEFRNGEIIERSTEIISHDNLESSLVLDKLRLVCILPFLKYDSNVNIAIWPFKQVIFYNSIMFLPCVNSNPFVSCMSFGKWLES